MSSQHIIALIAKEGASAADVVIAAAAVTHTSFIADDIVAVTTVDFATAVDGVVSIAAVERVGAVVVDNGIGTRPAGDEIVAFGAHDCGISITTDDCVVTKAGEDHVSAAV